MADSNITKRVLKNSLKILMSETSFSKICIADICNKCSMNRKSFYYHFHDKYELVNWTFDSEFVLKILPNVENSFVDILKALCGYLYTNRVFYRQAFAIEGQNSFCDHFADWSKKELAVKLKLDGEHIEYMNRTFSIMLLNSVKCWIIENESISPKEFVESFLHIFNNFSKEALSETK